MHRNRFSPEDSQVEDECRSYFGMRPVSHVEAEKNQTLLTTDTIEKTFIDNNADAVKQYATHLQTGKLAPR